MELLAWAVKRAAQIREESFDHEAKDREQKQQRGRLFLIDMKKFYKISLHKACDMAAEEVGFDAQGTMPIYLLLRNSWNEVLDWAEPIHEK